MWIHKEVSDINLCLVCALAKMGDDITDSYSSASSEILKEKKNFVF